MRERGTESERKKIDRECVREGWCITCVCKIEEKVALIRMVYFESTSGGFGFWGNFIKRVGRRVEVKCNLPTYHY